MIDIFWILILDGMMKQQSVLTLKRGQKLIFWTMPILSVIFLISLLIIGDYYVRSVSYTHLQENKELTGLKGLLYFTDGQGIFPNKMPPYDTAFILMQKDYQEVEVPPWAMKIYIQEEGAEHEY